VGSADRLRRRRNAEHVAAKRETVRQPFVGDDPAEGSPVRQRTPRRAVAVAETPASWPSLGGVDETTRQVQLVSWDGPWEADDPDANFKADVALYAKLDPMASIARLAAALQMPEGAIVQYVLAKWASGGSGGLLELGPTMANRLFEPIERAEQEGSDEARLRAYDQLRQMISWLRLPLVDPEHSGY
jgi:Family of unknown function (DUF6027)